MNKNIINILFISFLSVILAAGCSDEENDDFEGTDNYILSFSLKQGDAVYSSVIRGDEFILNAPIGVSLNNATAEYTLSENATISPDPATITDWNTETAFVISSHNKKGRAYKYRINRSAVVSEGSVVLNSQAQVEELAAKGYSSISGDLIIGLEATTDIIRSLESLRDLKEINGNLVINNAYRGDALTGLDNLRTVGSVQINSVDSLIDFTMSSLEEVKADVSIVGNNIFVVSVPKLRKIGGSLSVNTSAKTVEFPSLQTIGYNFTYTIQGASILTGLNFQQLKTIGGAISIARADSKATVQLSSVGFPQLEKCGTISMASTKSIGLMYLPKLEQIEGNLSLADNPYVDLNFASLKSVGGVNVKSSKKASVNFSELKSVDGDLTVTVTDFKLQNLTKLETVGGLLKINNKVDGNPLPQSLKKAGTLQLEGNYPEVDLRGMEIGLLTIASDMYSGCTIMGDDVFAGDITFSNTAVSDFVFPTMQGFKEVGKVYCVTKEFNMPDLETVNGDFSLSGPSVFNMPKLNKVNGNVDFYISGTQTNPTMEISGVKEVTGNFTLTMSYVRDLNTLKLNNMVSVGGNMVVIAGFGANYSLTELLFPSLKTVEGALGIYPNSATSSSANTKLANLDGFSTLEKVGSMEIKYFTALSSFEGIKKIVPSLTAETWNASGNLYNPTYDQLSNGEWTKTQN